MVKLAVIFLFGTLAALCGAANVNSDWWKTAVFYQIYPRSFKDSNDDGIGDLQGIISKLDYLKNLGITATWLSPIFQSPQRDMGYDISDYKNIHSEYGNMTDLQELLTKAHDLGIKIILDFVPNHTSDEHDWFKQSEKNDPIYKDYYIWHDGLVDPENATNFLPPNNWISIFEGPAWSYSEIRKQFYLHQFSEYQPDLNYNNPNVQKAMMEILTFWLDQGVDGFRVDAVPYLVEDSKLRNEPKLDDTDESGTYKSLNHTYTMDLSNTYETIYMWRKHVDEYSQAKGGDTRILMTEAYTNFENTLLYYGTADGSALGSHFTFNFDFITSLNNASTAEDIKDIIDKWTTYLPKSYTFNWVLGNHDNHRVATRFGTEHIDALNMLVAILPGIQVTYNGEEFGMEDGWVNCTDSHDPAANCDNWDMSRDFERTPLQWDDTANAGFSNNETTWLPVSDKYLECNVKKELKDDRSYLKTYKLLVELRKQLPSDDTTINVTDNVLHVSRVAKDSCTAYHYLYNRYGKEAKMTIPNAKETYSFKVMANSLNSDKTTGSSLVASKSITLKANEALIVMEKCDKAPSSAFSLWNLSQLLFWASLLIVFKL